jgi:hypothetical protein
MSSPSPRLFAVLFALALLFSLFPAGARPAAAQSSRCFTETNQCIAGPIRDYWERNGGLPIFGFPITEQRQETVEGRTLQVQWFERDRIEIQLDGSVTTGRLGVDRLAQIGTPWQQGGKTAADAGCAIFQETGHQVCGQFRSFWERNGGLARLGLPVTGEFQTTIEGKNLTVQYFERRRFELHEGNQVLLGLLGREVLTANQGGNQGGGQGGQADPCAGVPAPLNARIRPSNCFSAGTQAAIDVFGFRPNEQVGFWFNTPDNEIFGTIETYNVGPTGAVNDLPLDTSELTPGTWSFVMEGTSSGHKAIAYFRIVGEAPAPPVSGDVPAPVSAVVTPSQGPAGTIFEFQGFGFRPGEKIGVYITEPSQSVFGAPFQVEADGAGFSEVVTFESDSSLPKGVYAITFEGVSSKHRAVAYFRIQ